jgi:hypothetical protein
MKPRVDWIHNWRQQMKLLNNLFYALLATSSLSYSAPVGHPSSSDTLPDMKKKCYLMFNWKLEVLKISIVYRSSASTPKSGRPLQPSSPQHKEESCRSLAGIKQPLIPSLGPSIKRLQRDKCSKLVCPPVRGGRA